MEGYIQPGSLGVTSVNGHTGEVNLTATDVKARPDTWVPSDNELSVSKISLGNSRIVAVNEDQRPGINMFSGSSSVGSFRFDGATTIGQNFSMPQIVNRDYNSAANIYTSANPPYPRVPGAQEGNVALFDAQGNIVSSGRSFWNFHRATFTLTGTTLYINTVA